MPTPQHKRGRPSPLRHEISPFELAWQHEQSQIQTDYFHIDDEDDFYEPEDDFDMMDVDEPAPDLVVDEGFDETMDFDCDYSEIDNEKLISSIYDTLRMRPGAAGTPRTNTAFANCAGWAEEVEEDSKSTESVHCARCHSTYAPRDNGSAACIVPHVFEFEPHALDGGWCASACCGPSIQMRRGTNGEPDEVRAKSVLGETGLDVCFRGRHTQSPKTVAYTNGINRTECMIGPYGCASRRLTYGMGRQLFTTDLCVRRS